MAWDFQTDPDFQEKLDWIKQFCEEKVEPLHHVFPHAVRLPVPAVKAYVKALQQEVKDEGLWALFLDEELGGPASGRASWRERVCRYGQISVVAVVVKKKTLAVQRLK